MNRRKKYRISIRSLPCTALLLWISIASCHNGRKELQTENAFYYWRSVLNITSFEQKVIDSLQIKTLYVKYFDVDWDNTLHRPVPKASLRTDEAFKSKLEIIPCIFITNECIQKLDSPRVEELSKNIMKLVADINQSLGIKNREIQFDCDWTAKSSKVYFSLLEFLKENKSTDSTTASANISATIRLYQVKYLNKTGVPPVNRGLLMAYNMGNLRDPSGNNSILETSELKKYVTYLSSYPIDLDVALPIFEWTVWFREKSFMGLISKLPPQALEKNISKKIASNRYEILTDTVIAGYTFKKKDELRIEQSEPAEILRAGGIIREKLRNRNLRLALFHLDSLTLSKYSLHELETFFSSLN